LKVRTQAAHSILINYFINNYQVCIMLAVLMLYKYYYPTDVQLRSNAFGAVEKSYLSRTNTECAVFGVCR
jgi:hypothetical protein